VTDDREPVRAPLAGLRVVELAGVGAVSMAGMMLADLGAETVRVDRPGGPYPITEGDPVLRGRRHVRLDLADDAGRAAALELSANADVVLEAMRPGVAERRGLGPEDCLSVNPRLVYARITGWGQDGPMAHRAGHDINYLAITGVLHDLAREEQLPSNLTTLLHFGGGAMFGVVGVLAALYEVASTGIGRVVDAATVDGVGLLGQMDWSFRHRGRRAGSPEATADEASPPFYGMYRCADGGLVAVAAIEPGFYALLLRGLGLAADDLPPRDDPRNWVVLQRQLAAAFETRTRDEWAVVFADSDACVTPVLTPEESAGHPHLRARNAMITRAGVAQAAPAPRFSGDMPTRDSRYAVEPVDAVLADWSDP
jgi:alpha-methylacyl-CoA racemase